MKGPGMMMNTTLDQLRQLKLVSMAQALQEQMQQNGISAMSFEERLALLVDREVHGPLCPPAGPDAPQSSWR